MSDLKECISQYFKYWKNEWYRCISSSSLAPFVTPQSTVIYVILGVIVSTLGFHWLYQVLLLISQQELLYLLRLIHYFCVLFLHWYFVLLPVDHGRRWVKLHVLWNIAIPFQIRCVERLIFVEQQDWIYLSVFPLVRRAILTERYGRSPISLRNILPVDVVELILAHHFQVLLS